MNFYVADDASLRPVSTEWTARDRCPACFGTDICDAVERQVFEYCLTLWRPLLPYGYSYKASYVRPGEAIICNFWHQGWGLSVSPSTLTLRAERQSARISKITNDSLTLSDTGCTRQLPFIAVPVWQQWASKGTDFHIFCMNFCRALLSVCLPPICHLSVAKISCQNG